MTKEIRILFLGAGRRVWLVQAFMIDARLLVLAQSKECFETVGTKVLISGSAMIAQRNETEALGLSSLICEENIIIADEQIGGAPNISGQFGGGGIEKNEIRPLSIRAEDLLRRAA